MQPASSSGGTLVRQINAAILSVGYDRPPWLPTDLNGARWARCQTHVEIDGRIVDGLRVADVAPELDLQGPPGVLPQLRVPSSRENRRVGRRRRAETEPELTRYLAWAKDIANSTLTMPQLAKLLYDDDHPDARTLKGIERALATGRQLEHDRGVLPWAAYERGRVLTQWRTDPDFIAGVHRWQAEAIRAPVDESQPGDWSEHAELVGTVRRIKQQLSWLTRLLTASCNDVELLWEHGIEPWTPTVERFSPDDSAEQRKNRNEQRRPRRALPKPRPAAPMTRRYVCPICGGPHVRAEHGED
jgi:hypothetical protein